MAVVRSLRLLTGRKAAETPPIGAIDIAAPDEDDLAIPADANTVFLGGLFALAVLAGCYAAAEIALPIVLAFVLSLVLQPAMRQLERLYLPRAIAALLIIVLLFGTLAGLGTALLGPAASWAQKLPSGIPKLQERLSFVSRPLTAVEKFVDQAQGLTQGDQPKALAVAVQGSGLSDRLLTGTRSLASGFLETVLVLFFLLVSGDTFLRRLVEVLPRFKNKRQAVEIFQVRCGSLPVYNYNHEFGCGGGDRCSHGVLRGWRSVAVGNGCLPAQLYSDSRADDWCCGLPACRPLIHSDPVAGFLPAGLYLAIHLAEGETVTPMLLARRFTINPVLVILALVFWYWMWGVPGAILATPMLAITKIICDRIRPLTAFGHFMEG